jgi:hypothetical protein
MVNYSENMENMFCGKDINSLHSQKSPYKDATVIADKGK